MKIHDINMDVEVSVNALLEHPEVYITGAYPEVLRTWLWSLTNKGHVADDSSVVRLSVEERYDRIYNTRLEDGSKTFIVQTNDHNVLLGASKDAVFYTYDKSEHTLYGPYHNEDGYTSNQLQTSGILGYGRFTSRGIKKVSSDDYIYDRIHRRVDKLLENSTGIISDEVVDKWLEEAFNKEFTEELNK